MDYTQIKQLAWNGATPDEIKVMNAPEHTCYQGLLYLCKQYKAGQITQDELKKATAKVQDDFEYYQNAFKAEQRNIADWCGYIRESEILRAEINKSQDVCEIALKALQCIGLMTGDDSFFKNNSGKIQTGCGK